VHFLEGLKQGFDLFDVTPMATDRVRFNLSYRPAHATIDRAIEYLTAAERGPKTFTWIHLYDVHEAAVEETRIDPAALRAVAPVSIRTFLEERHGIRGDRINLWLIDRYDALIRRVDRQIQRLYSALEAIGKFGRALWIVTADHGEGLGNHGIWAHDRYLYQEQVRVPLILHFGDRRSSGVRVTALVRHVDLLPTLMALLGARMPAVAARSDHRARIAGQSLLPLMAGEVPSLPFPYAFSQRRPASHRSWKQGTVVALQSHRHKYILHTRGPDEFYDLEADPFESTNMADVHSPEQELMKSTLVRMLADAARQRGDDRASRVIDDKYVEQLRALGYL
jgi:arylsulfatase A-like enzyme